MSLLDASIWEGRIFSGTWKKGRGGTAAALEPATGRELGRYGLAGLEDVAEAAQAASPAQVEWAARSPEDRAKVLRRAGELFGVHAGEIHDWIVRESGGIPAKAALETQVAATECFEASALPSLPQGGVLASNRDRWSYARRRPVGLVTVIAPFSFPLILSIRSVAPALALGNAVLLKPDPGTSVCGGVVLARIFEEAGLPAGLLHLLPGGIEVGEATVTAAEVRVVAFTGSTAAGRKVGALCAAHLKRAHLELGGRNAVIVLPGADAAKAASAAAFGPFMHHGQICMAAGRHIVHDSLYEDYVEALAAKARSLPLGDPSTGRVALGPVIDERRLQRVDATVQDAVLQGARLVAGGMNVDLFYQPTVLADVQPGNPAWREEIFGPVAPVARFSTVERAIALANGNGYGLTAAILGDVGEAVKIADRLDSGKVHISGQTVSGEPEAPFGGPRNSGNETRAGGPAANLESFTGLQWLTMPPEIAPYPF